MAVVETWLRYPMFKSLQNPYYRWFWLGRLASSATFQMSTVAQGWLIYKLTGSAFALGWVGAGGSIATLLLSPYGGVLSDRFEKRTILMVTRVAMMLNILLLAGLIITDAVQVWHIALNALLGGVFMSLMMPAQTTMVSDLVDRETLLNAVSLTSVGMGLMGIIGGSLAGMMIEWFGVESVYLLMAALYLMALYTLSRLPLTGVSADRHTSVWSQMTQGLVYLKDSRALLLLLGLAIVRALFSMPYRTLLPKYAEDVMGLGASGLGILSSAPGVGSLASSLAVAALGDFRGKGKLLLISGALGGLALMAFGGAHGMLPAVAFLALIGAAGNATMVCNQTLMQVNCSDRYRGRVMSTYSMVWGLAPLGTIPAGIIADGMGVPVVLAGQGLILVLVFGGLWVRSMTLRTLE